MTGPAHFDYRQPRDRKSMHARIVRDLGLRIVGGELPPGTRLPPEATLLAAYEVSRPVLREAIRVLAAKGLVASKQRAGAIVRERSGWHLLDPDVLYWFIQGRPQPEFLQTLLTVRRVFEPAAAAIAARVATEDDLRRIEAAYAGMESATTPDEMLGPDLAFHRGIAQATHNDLLAYIGNMLSLAVGESIKLSSRVPNAHRLSLPRHKAILTALRAQDPLAAQQATLIQLQETRADLSVIIESAAADVG